ncbi:MAG: YbhB/YbcL family Raf kinase inhibitor-like protein [Proteobacteria bacterium]|nr:YbhB/YbcL family Raf kinase inhibitor-like protein [Pseudomonadota bacterium]
MRFLLPFALSAIAGVASAFSLSSPVIHEGATIPMQQVYTRCGGGNVSPQLAWRDAPKDTRGFAVTVFDPDAGGGGFWHWIAFNIGAGAYGLNPGAGTPHSGDAPGDTVQWTNGFGDRGYSGPCPPPGKPHRYVFTAYALDVPVLPVSAAASTDAVIAAIRKHALATATLTARYQR